MELISNNKDDLMKQFKSLSENMRVLLRTFENFNVMVAQLPDKLPTTITSTIFFKIIESSMRIYRDTVKSL
jgi:hypothetical protein